MHTEPAADRPVAVVTGANRGIGREVVRQLADRGFTVVLGSRDPAKGAREASRLDPGGDRVVPLQLDVADPGQRDRPLRPGRAAARARRRARLPR
jgi:NAD(P)-dependent dehydrogenase (short-subunit alcohol dehydrogenase family)